MPEITLSAEQRVPLPGPLPAVSGDFDWNVRDYDGFRLFMMEELAARFPERTRWTPADVEVVLVEVLAAVLDQLSDCLDRVAAEASLTTARRPDSVRRLLRLIGYDAVRIARYRQLPPFDPVSQASRAADDQRSPGQQLDQYWLNHPEAMEAGRRAGPRAIETQRRFVTLDDYVQGLAAHPLVASAQAHSRWGGAWPVIYLSLTLVNDYRLDQQPELPQDLRQAVMRFHRERQLRLVDLSVRPRLRTVLRAYVDHYRMAGQEVVLRDAVPMTASAGGPRLIAITIQITKPFRQAEVKAAIEQVLTVGDNAFFGPSPKTFGQGFFSGDLFQVLMEVEGVENVRVELFAELVARSPDRPSAPSHGAFHLQLRGGRQP